MLGHVLIELVDDHDRVGVPKGVAPVTLEAVPPRVVGAGESHVIARRLSSEPALIAHRSDDPVLTVTRYHRSIGAREDPAVRGLQLVALQARKLCQCALDLVRCDAHVILGLFGHLGLQASLRIDQARALREDQLLELARLQFVPLLHRFCNHRCRSPIRCTEGQVQRPRR